MKKTLQERLRQYDEIAKGVGKSIKPLAKTSLALDKVGKSILAVTLPVLSISSANAQCQGPANGGSNIVINNNSYPFDLNNDGVNDAKLQGGTSGGGSLVLNNIPGGDAVSFFVTGTSAFASLLSFNAGDDITGTIKHANSAFIAFQIGTGNVLDGALTIGQTKYFGFEAGGTKGFIQLKMVSYTAGGTFTIQILERGTDNDGGTTKAGDCASLPVALIDFNSKAKDGAIQLNWKTASEENNAGFEVQRSNDGKNFETLDFVEGHGTTLEEQEYFYDDKALRQNQEYYYRLKQIDYDGQFEYSDVITASLKNEMAEVGNFYPNPTNNGATRLDYVANANTVLTVTVYNVSGQELTREIRAVNLGNNNLSFDFSALNKGAYFVKLQAGESTQYQKLIIE